MRRPVPSKKSNNPQRLALRLTVASTPLACVATTGTALAANPCDHVTKSEASKLFGETASKKVAHKGTAASDAPTCVIHSATKGQDTLTLDVDITPASSTPPSRTHRRRAWRRSTQPPR